MSHEALTRRDIFRGTAAGLAAGLFVGLQPAMAEAGPEVSGLRQAPALLALLLGSPYFQWR
jgi:hypothetical protein